MSIKPAARWRRDRGDQSSRRRVDGRGAAGPLEPARRGPTQHQLRRRQHSAKGLGDRPGDRRAVELLWVKGSGGDLGTLTEAGLAVLRLDRLRALVRRLSGCRTRGRDGRRVRLLPARPGGAAPSIDTAMHGLIDAAHVDHLHPDAGIAFATAADGEALTAACFGDRVAWVPIGAGRASSWASRWPRSSGRNPQAIGCDPRRPRHHRVGRHLRRDARRARWRSSRPRPAVHRRAGSGRALRAAGRRATARSRRSSGTPGRRRCRR